MRPPVSISCFVPCSSILKDKNVVECMHRLNKCLGTVKKWRSENLYCWAPAEMRQAFFYRAGWVLIGALPCWRSDSWRRDPSSSSYFHQGSGRQCGEILFLWSVCTFKSHEFCVCVCVCWEAILCGLLYFFMFCEQRLFWTIFSWMFECWKNLVSNKNGLLGVNLIKIMSPSRAESRHSCWQLRRM